MEISEKEQKSIANFKYCIDTNTERGICYLPDYICAKVLNLIEKLQKENEELKEENEYNKLLLELNNNFTIDKKTGNYKWNVIEIQKIKDKIEDLKMSGGSDGKDNTENTARELAIEALQDILEESEE